MYQLDATWILTDKQCTRLHTNSAGPQPQHLWHNTTWAVIQHISTPEDGHVNVRNM